MSESRQDRGINDILGYIVVFALVIVSITFVTLSGMTALEDTRDAEKVNNAERAFDVVADNMEAIYARGAPSRATELDLGNAELFYANNVSITIEGDGTVLAERELRPVELRATKEESLVYEGGAVFRDRGNGTASIVNEPPFLISQDRVHIPVIQTTAPAIESAGSTTVLLRGKSTERSVVVSDTTGSYSTITIEISSARYEAWEDHLEDNGALSCSTDDATETVTCDTTSSPDLVYISVQQIELSLIL